MTGYRSSSPRLTSSSWSASCGTAACWDLWIEHFSLPFLVNLQLKYYCYFNAYLVYSNFIPHYVISTKLKVLVNTVFPLSLYLFRCPIFNKVIINFALNKNLDPVLFTFGWVSAGVECGWGVKNGREGCDVGVILKRK